MGLSPVLVLCRVGWTTLEKSDGLYWVFYFEGADSRQSVCETLSPYSN